MGAGSLFFSLCPHEAVLSDANEHLIRCYQEVRDRPARVADYLLFHAKKTGRHHFYDVRRQYNRSTFSAAQAARFIYLNRTCFNGIFRVNLRGEFNVPYGWKEPPPLPDRLALQAASVALRRTTLLAEPFESSLKRVRKGDFVYLDPPYPPLNGTAYFTHYTMERFGTTDQERLARAVKHLDKEGVLFMMSNADRSFIRRLYDGFSMKRLTVTRSVTCKAHRYQTRELLITNYHVAL